MTDKFAEFKKLFEAPVREPLEKEAAAVDGASQAEEMLARLEGTGAEEATEDSQSDTNFHDLVLGAKDKALDDLLVDVKQAEDNFYKAETLGTRLAGTSGELTKYIKDSFQETADLVKSVESISRQETFTNPGFFLEALRKEHDANTPQPVQESVQEPSVVEPTLDATQDAPGSEVGEEPASDIVQDAPENKSEEVPTQETPATIKAPEDDEPSGKVVPKNQAAAAISYMYHQFKAILDPDEAVDEAIKKGEDKTRIYLRELKKFTEGQGEVHSGTYKEITVEALKQASIPKYKLENTLPHQLANIPGIRLAAQPPAEPQVIEQPAEVAQPPVENPTANPQIVEDAPENGNKVVTNQPSGIPHGMANKPQDRVGPLKTRIASEEGDDSAAVSELVANNRHLVGALVASYSELARQKLVTPTDDFKARVEKLYNSMVELKERIRRAIGSTADVIEDNAMGETTGRTNVAGDVKAVKDILAFNEVALKEDLKRVYQDFYSIKTSDDATEQITELEAVVKSSILPDLKEVRTLSDKIAYSDMEGGVRVASAMSYLSGVAALEENGSFGKAVKAIKASYVGANIYNPDTAFENPAARFALARTARRCESLHEALQKLSVSSRKVVRALNEEGLGDLMAAIKANSKFNKVDVLRRKGLDGGVLFGLLPAVDEESTDFDIASILEGRTGRALIESSCDEITSALGHIKDQKKINFAKMFPIYSKLARPHWDALTEFLTKDGNLLKARTLIKQEPQAFLKVWSPYMRLMDASANGYSPRKSYINSPFLLMTDSSSPKADLASFEEGVKAFIKQVENYDETSVDKVQDAGDLARFLETHGFLISADLAEGESLEEALDKRFADACIELGVLICTKDKLTIRTLGQVQQDLIVSLAGKGASGIQKYCDHNYHSVIAAINPTLKEIDLIIADDEKGMDAVNLITDSEASANAASGIIGNLLGCILSSTLMGPLKFKGRDNNAIAKEQANLMLYLLTGKSSDLAKILGEAPKLSNRPDTKQGNSFAFDAEAAADMNRRLSGKVFYKHLSVGGVTDPGKSNASDWSLLSLKLFSDYLGTEKDKGSFTDFFSSVVIPGINVVQNDDKVESLVSIAGANKLRSSFEILSNSVDLDSLYKKIYGSFKESPSSFISATAGSLNKHTSLKTWSALSMNLVGFLVSSQLAVASTAITGALRTSIKGSVASMMRQLLHAKPVGDVVPDQELVASIDRLSERAEQAQASPAVQPVTPDATTAPATPTPKEEPVVATPEPTVAPQVNQGPPVPPVAPSTVIMDGIESDPTSLSTSRLKEALAEIKTLPADKQVEARKALVKALVGTSPKMPAYEAPGTGTGTKDPAEELDPTKETAVRNTLYLIIKGLGEGTNFKPRKQLQIARAVAKKAILDKEVEDIGSNAFDKIFPGRIGAGESDEILKLFGQTQP